MIPRSPLEDPRIAAFAWARFRRLMRLMLAITVAMVIGALVLLYRENGLVSIHLYIAAALGIGFAMLLMSALMGLVFLSHGTGHDDAVVDPQLRVRGIDGLRVADASVMPDIVGVNTNAASTMIGWHAAELLLRG